MADYEKYSFHPDDLPTTETLKKDYTPLKQARDVVTDYLIRNSSGLTLGDRKKRYYFLKCLVEAAAERHLNHRIKLFKLRRKEVLDEINLHHPKAYKGPSQAEPRSVGELLRDLDLINKEIQRLENFINSPTTSEAGDD